jgi:hypothetical protein
MEKSEALVKKIIRRHGKMIDLEKQPGVIIDIIRKFGRELDDDGGLPPGGTPPPPGPTSFQDEPTNRELMKEVLKISRAVAAINKRMGP